MEARRRIKQALVSFDEDGNPLIVEATYVDEMGDPRHPRRMLGNQENNREMFDALPKKEKDLTRRWLSECITEMLERQDPQEVED